MARFKANPANRGQVLHTGVWRYTRHPNYFGDAIQWWAYYLVALAAGGFWAIFSPILMTMATIANVTSLLDYLNWGGWGISSEAWTVIMLVAGIVIASAVSLTRGDVAYMLVIVWAFAGIAVKHASTPVVATAAWVTTALAALMLVVGLVFRKRLRVQDVT